MLWLVSGSLTRAVSAAAVYLLLFWLIGGEPWEEASTYAGGLAIVVAIWHFVATLRAGARAGTGEPE